MSAHPFHIEFTGCSGSGKSRLARAVIQRLMEYGENVESNQSDYFTASRRFSPLLRSPTIQNIFLELRAIWILGLRKRYWPFIAFCNTLISKTRMGWRFRLTLRRGVLRKLGLYEYWRTSPWPGIRISDEGTVHTAHNALVFPDYIPSDDEINAFCELVPLADLVVIVRISPERAFSRTQARPDPPLKTDPKTLRLYLTNACLVFDRLTLHPRIARCALVLDGEAPIDDNIRKVTEMLRSGLRLEAGDA